MFYFSLFYIIMSCCIYSVLGYPWDSVFAIGNNSFGSMERWLYLPHVGNDTLNKYLLYGMNMIISNYIHCTL